MEAPLAAAPAGSGACEPLPFNSGSLQAALGTAVSGLGGCSPQGACRSRAARPPRLQPAAAGGA